MSQFGIRPATVDDAGEVLTVQRAAFVSPALIYSNVHHPALLQTLEEVRADLAGSLAFAAVERGRLVGAVRSDVDGSDLRVRRLAVAPDRQGAGIGTALLEHLEAVAPVEVDRLVLDTGHLNAPTLRLYRHLGFVETRREVRDAELTLVHLAKPRTGPVVGLDPSGEPSTRSGR